MRSLVFKHLTIVLFCIVLFASCDKNTDEPNTSSDGDITATFQFSDGETVDFAFTSGEDDLLKPYVYGPNSNDHYKLYLRGEKEIDGKIYTINLYVTMPEKGIGDYPFGRAWQWHDKGFVTEILIGVTEKGNPISLKQYMSMEIDNTHSKGVTISSLTDNHVKGTFSGLAMYTESDVITINNGKFDIAVNRGNWED